MFDLHFHSDASDGLASLETVIRVARAHRELTRLALSDHDSIAASVRLAAVDRRAWVGAELTSYTGNRRVDLLAVGVHGDDRRLNAYLAQRVLERRDRFAVFGELLRARGWAFDPPAEVWARPQLASPHVTAELRRQRANHDRLTKLGIPVVPVDGAGDPMYKLVLDELGPEVRARTETVVLDGPNAIAMIHAAGGLAFVAHPWISPYDRGKQTRTKARRLLDTLVGAGLDGLELWHSDQTEASVVAELRDYARSHELLLGAGSDDHTVDLAWLGANVPGPAEAPALLARIEAAWRRRQAQAARAA